MVVVSNGNGSIHGGGRFVTPLGGLRSHPLDTPTVVVNMTAKYQNKSSTPHGKFSLNSTGADLRFSSSSLDWLVISGPNAIFAGRGELNGAPNYDFLVSAWDSGSSKAPDRIRVKIWNRVTGQVIYDTQLGSADNISPQTALASGNIVVKEKGQKLMAESAQRRHELEVDAIFAEQAWSGLFKPGAQVLELRNLV